MLYENQYILTYLATVGGINNSQTTGIKLQSVAGVDTTKPGIILVNYSDPLDETKCEWITYTSIDVNQELVGAVRGAEKGSAKAHGQNVVVAFPHSESHNNQFADIFQEDAVTSNAQNVLLKNRASAPTTPSAGYLKIYSKTDDKVYKKTSGGVESELGANFATLNPPQGFLINGKIVTSVASNNLTVAIKTLADADPSATDPVYVRIGNTIRTITAALSVTKNAGTNYFDAGGARFATLEIDYFVYLGYNATDGVVIGFARIPTGKYYSDFSTTSTAETYCAISTITTAASTDEYENIGRFNAVLSAGAGYTWSIPATSIIFSRPIFHTRNLSYNPIWSDNNNGSGTTLPAIGNGTKVGKYCIQGEIINCDWKMQYGSTTTYGASGAFYTMSPPLYPATLQPWGGLLHLLNDTSWQRWMGLWQIGTAIASCDLDYFHTTGTGYVYATTPFTMSTNDILSAVANYKYR